MKRPRPSNSLTIALWANALLLAAILLSLLNKNTSPSTAFAQQQPPIAGGAGVFVMPAQIEPTKWGAYLLDVDAQTLCVYQFYPGEKQLRLVAARDYKYDRKLKRFNTENPTPNEVKALVEREAAGLNAAANNPNPAPATRQDPKLDDK